MEALVGLFQQFILGLPQSEFYSFEGFGVVPHCVNSPCPR